MAMKQPTKEQSSILFCGQNELYRRAKRDEAECAARISDYKRIYLTTQPEPAKVVA